MCSTEFTVKSRPKLVIKSFNSDNTVLIKRVKRKDTEGQTEFRLQLKLKLWPKNIHPKNNLLWKAEREGLSDAAN